MKFALLGQAGGGVDREVFLNVKHGVEAKSYEDVSWYWKSLLDVKLLDTGWRKTIIIIIINYLLFQTNANVWYAGAE